MKIENLNVYTVRVVDLTATDIIEDISYILNNYKFFKNNVEIETSINEIKLYIKKDKETDRSKFYDVLKLSYANSMSVYSFEFRIKGTTTFLCNVATLPKILFNYDFDTLYQKAKSLEL